MNKKLKPCALCGDTNTRIVVTDACRQSWGELGCDYETDPCRGRQWYGILHAEGGGVCLLDTHNLLGDARYNKPEDAIEAWNSRWEEPISDIRDRLMEQIGRASNPEFIAAQIALRKTECPKCNQSWGSKIKGTPNYCPNCGAKVTETSHE